MLISDYVNPIIIGNPYEIVMNVFAEEIIKSNGTSQKIINLPLPIDDLKQRRPDFKKTRELLG